MEYNPSTYPKIASVLIPLVKPEAIAAAMLLIKSLAPGTAKEKEIHLPLKR